MYRRFTIFLAAALLALTTATGCSLIRRGQREPRPARVSDLAADTNAKFRELWISQRSTELQAEGVAASTAESRANSEYAERFPYAQPRTR